MKKRIEPKLTEHYQKSEEYEIFLDKLNSILSPYQKEEYKDIKEKYPTLHIVGSPRSGTTLLTQLLAAHTNIGYINNLIAAFWQAPVYGIQLSKKLLKTDEITPTYQSDCGRTQGINEPHEFGYFWSTLLDYKEMKEHDSESVKLIDWERLRLILNNMTHAFNSPILFKSFLLGWHIENMQKVLPNTCWVHIKRNVRDNALSILNLREKMLGSYEQWAGPKPKEYVWLKNESYFRQIAGQIYFLEKKYRKQLSNISEDKKLELTYEQLCDDPQTILKKICSLLHRNNGNTEIISLPPGKFTKSNHNIFTPDSKSIQKAMNYFYN